MTPQPTLMLCIAIPFWFWPVISSVLLFLLIAAVVFFIQRHASYIYFDPQDFATFEGGGNRKLPVAASTATFAPHLQTYVQVTSLLITVAAASIAFGTSP